MRHSRLIVMLKMSLDVILSPLVVVYYNREEILIKTTKILICLFHTGQKIVGPPGLSFGPYPQVFRCQAVPYIALIPKLIRLFAGQAVAAGWPAHGVREWLVGYYGSGHNPV